MSSNDPAAPGGSSPRPWQKASILVIAALAIVHTVLIAVWLAPSSPVRDAVGAGNLATYVDPYFQQAWGHADPSAQFVDERLLIRAEILDVASGKKHTTAWLDITKAEQPALRHNLQPARVHLVNRRLATNLNAATFALNSTQKTLVRKNYTKLPLRRTAAKLYRAGPVPGAVTDYLAYDAMTVQFATMYATATWGEEVTKVQYRVGRKALPTFAHRDQAKTRAYSYFSFGWRKALPAQEEAQAAFDSYVKK